MFHLNNPIKTLTTIRIKLIKNLKIAIVSMLFFSFALTSHAQEVGIRLGNS